MKYFVPYEIMHSSFFDRHAVEEEELGLEDLAVKSNVIQEQLFKEIR